MSPVPIESSAIAPWKSRPASQVRVGRSAEAALSSFERHAVLIDAFEVGAIRTANQRWKIAAFIVLAPIWMPLFLLVSAVLIVPSWIYFPYRTYREWNEAKSLGVSSGMMILGVAVVFGFGIVGGVVMALVLLGKVVPLGNIVVVARTGDRVVLLYQEMPMFNYPQFRKTEYFPRSSLSQDPSSTNKKVILSLKGADASRTIVVRRLAAWATGSPEVNQENLRILLRG